MADIQFRLLRSVRLRAEPASPSPVQQFLQRVEREANGPSEELTRIYQAVMRNPPRRRA